MFFIGNTKCLLKLQGSGQKMYVLNLKNDHFILK